MVRTSTVQTERPDSTRGLSAVGSDDFAGIGTFFEQIRSRPAFLFIGQSYLALNSGTDLFLKYSTEKFRESNDNHHAYDDLLASQAGLDPEAATAWMDELSKRIGIPAWIQTIAPYHWSGIYTSAIDSVWP